MRKPNPLSDFEHVKEIGNVCLISMLASFGAILFITIIVYLAST